MSKEDFKRRKRIYGVIGLFFTVPAVIIPPVLMNSNVHNGSTILSNLLMINDLNSSKTASEIKTIISNKKKGDELIESDLGVSTSKWNTDSDFSHKLLMIDDGINYSGNIGQPLNVKVQLLETSNTSNNKIKFISINPYIVDFQIIQDEIRKQNKSTNKTNSEIKQLVSKWSANKSINQQDLSNLGIDFKLKNNVTITEMKYKSAAWSTSRPKNIYENYVKIDIKVSSRGETSTFEVKLHGKDSKDLLNSEKTSKTQAFLDNITDKTVEDAIPNKFGIKPSEFNPINFKQKLLKIFPGKFGENAKYKVISSDNDKGEVKIEVEYTYDSNSIAKKTYTMTGFNKPISDADKKTDVQRLLDKTTTNKIQSAITNIGNIFPTSFDVSDPKNKEYLDSVFNSFYGGNATYNVEKQDDIKGNLELTVSYKFGQETASKKYQLAGFKQKTDQEIVDDIIASINIQDDRSPLAKVDIDKNIIAAHTKDETNLHTVFGLPGYDLSNIEKNGATITWSSAASSRPKGAKYTVSVTVALNGATAKKDVTVESSDIDTKPNPDWDIHQVYKDIIAIMPSYGRVRSTKHHWQLPGQETHGNIHNFISTFGLPKKYDISKIDTKGTTIEWDAIPTSTSNPSKYLSISIKISKNGGTALETYWCRVDSID